MTTKPKMSRDEVIEGLEKLAKDSVGDCKFGTWDLYMSAIALLQSQHDTKGQRVGEDIEEILKFHLTSEHGWHFDAPYPGYSFDPVKIIAHALAARLAVPKMDRERLAEIMYQEINQTVDVKEWDLEFPSAIRTKNPRHWKDILLRTADAIIADWEGER